MIMINPFMFWSILTDQRHQHKRNVGPTSKVFCFFLLNLALSAVNADGHFVEQN